MCEAEEATGWSADNPWHAMLYLWLLAECGWCGKIEILEDLTPDLFDADSPEEADWELAAVRGTEVIQSRGWRLIDDDFAICPACIAQHGLTRKPEQTAPRWRFWRR